MTLQPIEVDALTEHEATIANGLQTFKEVGCALADIRDRRLYRDGHGTFEDYCRERWNLSRTHADRMITASQVAKEMAPIGVISTESQARAIAPVLRDHGPKVAAEVLTEAAESGRVTARSITEAADGRTRPATRPEVITAEEFVERYEADSETTPDLDDLIPADLRFQRRFWRHMKTTHDLLLDMDFPQYFDEDMAASLVRFVDTIARKHAEFAKSRRTLRVVQGGNP